MTRSPHVVILGAGFTGLATAKWLQSARSSNDLTVTLVDQQPHHVFTPNLKVGSRHQTLCLPLRQAVSPGIQLKQARVQTIRLRDQQVVLEDHQPLDYDHLVLALGSTRAIALPLDLLNHIHVVDTLTGIGLVREELDRIAAALKSHRPSAAHPLTFLVIGAGLTGIETACHLAQWCRQHTNRFGLAPESLRVKLVEKNPTIAVDLSSHERTKIVTHLNYLNVDIQTNYHVDAAHIRRLVRDRAAGNTVCVWAGGTESHPVVRSIDGLQVGSTGKPVVDGHLRASGHQNVWIGGDLAGTTESKTAKTSVRHGQLIAYNIRATLDDRPLAAHEPRDQAYSVSLGTANHLRERFDLTSSFGHAVRSMDTVRLLFSYLPFVTAWRASIGATQPCDACMNLSSYPSIR